NSGSNSVSLINAATNTVVLTIPVSNSPYCVAITPDGAKVYVTESTGTKVAVIPTATNAVATEVPVTGDQPNGLAVSPDGSEVDVGFGRSNGVVAIATAPHTEPYIGFRPIRPDGQPVGLV